MHHSLSMVPWLDMAMASCCTHYRMTTSGGCGWGLQFRHSYNLSHSAILSPNIFRCLLHPIVFWTFHLLSGFCRRCYEIFGNDLLIGQEKTLDRQKFGSLCKCWEHYEQNSWEMCKFYRELELQGSWYFQSEKKNSGNVCNTLWLKKAWKI